MRAKHSGEMRKARAGRGGRAGLPASTLARAHPEVMAGEGRTPRVARADLVADQDPRPDAMRGSMRVQGTGVPAVNRHRLYRRSL